MSPFITVEVFSKKNNRKTEDQTALYYKQLTQFDTELINLVVLERELADLSDRMLTGVGMKYGFDSIEYEKAGGTRKCDKKIIFIGQQ